MCCVMLNGSVSCFCACWCVLFNVCAVYVVYRAVSYGLFVCE